MADAGVRVLLPLLALGLWAAVPFMVLDVWHLDAAPLADAPRCPHSGIHSGRGCPGAPAPEPVPLRAPSPDQRSA